MTVAFRNFHSWPIIIDFYTLPSGEKMHRLDHNVVRSEGGLSHTIEVAFYEKAPLKAKLKQIDRNHYSLVLY